ncbi:histone lysine methyltransferase Set1 [Schizosaccharomyces japonicus yFS275]|uniref:Histone-lysine N-methyltransferase, H3 lysine-4 specific n=1 Tax=Schizosaccharomyces japonicus (strain yFS275 / FY16936) TaxID=402676 RepID=B6JWJ3_SCHJY|nr:histone lysine methyltransferase Set1 [Schizosaccharomyces japonicus yFS275]EEB05744.1 histone lysine methyltransferase Set1 [Schizosaccharomyces japonicus yFS275]
MQTPLQHSQSSSQFPNGGAAPVKRRNYRVLYDPEIHYKAAYAKKPIYRFDGHAKPPIQAVDPREHNPNYSRGIPNSSRPVRKSLLPVQFEYDSNSIGPEPPTQVLITNLSPLVTANDIRYHFKTFGSVNEVDLQLNPYNGTSLGLCRVTFRKDPSVSAAHAAAKKAVASGTGLRLNGKCMRVELDKDGSLCRKAYERAVHALEEQLAAEEAHQQELAQAEAVAKAKAAALQAQAAAAASRQNQKVHRYGSYEPSYFTESPSHSHSYAPSSSSSSSALPSSSHSSHHPPENLDELVYLFIDDRFVPPDRVLYSDIRHHFRKYYYDRIYMDRRGFYITFSNYEEARECYYRLDRTYVNDCRIKLRFHEPPVLRNHVPEKDITTTTPRERVLKAATDAILTELSEVLLRDIKTKIAGPAIFKFFTDYKNAHPRSDKQEAAIEARVEPASIDAKSTKLEEEVPVDVPLDSLLHKKTVLPKFRKRVTSGTTTKGSKALPTAQSVRRRRRRHSDARPLYHRLNDNVDDSEYSEGKEDEDVSDTHYTQNILSETSSSEEEVEEGDQLILNTHDHETEEEEESEDNEDFLEKFHAASQKSKTTEEEQPDFTDEIDYTSSDEETVQEQAVAPLPEHTEVSESALKAERVETKIEATTVTIKSTISESIVPAIPVKQNTWSEDGFVFHGTLPNTYPEDEVLLDLDGFQQIVKDDEDLQYLREVVAAEESKELGDTNYWAYRRKESKIRNGDAEPSNLVLPFNKNEYHKPNSTGSARTEGYYMVPAAEKSQYLPLRNRVSLEKANTSSSRITSRMNRVNNRRLAAGVEKSNLNSETDLLRFNALKARKKQLRFGPSRIHTLGLFAMENIDKNDMVIEYVGEIVRQRVADTRERKYVREGIGDSYLFRIDKDAIVDATKKGNIARFINHSCAPNCIAKIIRVEGHQKIVIYADRDIEEGEELTYDYKFPEEVDKIPCLCGAPTCRGYLN